MTIICPFCKTEYNYHQLQVSLIRCKNHPAHIGVYLDSNFYSICGHSPQGSEQFAAIFILSKKNFTLMLGEERLLEMNDFPDITPENFEQKIQTLLKFN